MKKSRLTFLGIVFCIIFFLFGLAYGGTLIDFNDAPAGAVINDFYAAQGVVFSCSGGENCDGNVYTRGPSSCEDCSPDDYDGNTLDLDPSGGDCGFAETAVARADFACSPVVVRIDAIADDTEDPSFLRAYNSSGEMIDEDTADGIDDACQYVTLEVSGPGIAYVIFSGVDGDTNLFDNLYFDCDTAIPTITQWGLIGLFLLMSASGFWFVRRRCRA